MAIPKSDLEHVQQLSDALASYMKRHELSQHDFAAQLGIAQGDLSKLLRGQRGIGLPIARRIYEVCGDEIALSIIIGFGGNEATR